MGTLTVTKIASLLDTEKLTSIDLFTQTAAILNVFGFKEYYGMPRGALAQYLRALFGQKENFNVYFKGNRRSLLYQNTATATNFFPITIVF